jgi:hypothetical protein
VLFADTGLYFYKSCFLLPIDRKFLREAERLILAQMAHGYVLEAVELQLLRPEGEVRAHVVTVISAL